MIALRQIINTNVFFCSALAYPPRRWLLLSWKSAQNGFIILKILIQALSRMQITAPSLNNQLITNLNVIDRILYVLLKIGQDCNYYPGNNLTSVEQKYCSLQPCATYVAQVYIELRQRLFLTCACQTRFFRWFLQRHFFPCCFVISNYLANFFSVCHCQRCWTNYEVNACWFFYVTHCL